MSLLSRRFELASPEATARLAAALAPLLGPGDALLLEGQIGAGKTHFARALIQARLAADGAPKEDVPSPTFTLVQTYLSGTVEIWHADLYRLSHPDEIEELGLLQAMDEAICLVEWPCRLAGQIPANAMRMTFEVGKDDWSRVITFAGDQAHWAKIEPVFRSIHDAG